MPDEEQAQRCYRHPDRETGVTCSQCGRPICYECMIQAPVGFRCPTCVREQSGSLGRPTVVTREQTRRRWSQGAGSSAPGRATRAIIIITVAVYVLSIAALIMRGRFGELIDAGQMDSIQVAKGEYWRLFTANFLHSRAGFAGLLHIGFNMMALYFGGPYVELLAGRLKLVLVYLISGVAGYVAVYLLAPIGVITVGASTAVYGIFGFLFLFSVYHRGTPAGQALRNMGSIVLINLIFSFMVPGISWQGHVGGLLAGMVMFMVLSLFGRRDLRLPLNGAQIALTAVFVIILIGLVALRTAQIGAI